MWFSTNCGATRVGSNEPSATSPSASGDKLKINASVRATEAFTPRRNASTAAPAHCAQMIRERGGRAHEPHETDGGHAEVAVRVTGLRARVSLARAAQ